MSPLDQATGIDKLTGEKVTERLTDAEAQRCDELETVISKGMQTFVEVGTALAAIRDEGLWRDRSTSFANYIEFYWPDIGRAYAYRLIDAAEIDAELSPIGDTPKPANEGQSRALKPLKGQPEKAAEAMRAASADGPATAAKIAEEVEKVVDPDLAIREAREADRQRRVAEKAERDAAKKAAEAAERSLHDQARQRYPDVDRAATARAMSALFDGAADLLTYDATETAGYCNDLETDVRIVQATALVEWLTTHLTALQSPGASVTKLREAR